MTDTADLVKELRKAAIQRAEIAGDFNDASASWEAHLFSQAATELTRLSTENATLQARVGEVENLCALRAANNRELVAMLDDANKRTEAAEARAAAMREALEKLLPWLEDAETKCLVGDEGCIWAVEFVRQAIGERPCPRPIAGNKSGSARECIALGQCGCDEREIAARALEGRAPMTDKADKVHPVVEKVARAIANANVEGGACEPSPHAIECAKAAAKVLIEECAKVAEGWECDASDPYGSAFQASGNGRFWDAGTNYDQGHIDAASAIRFLSSELGLEG